MGRKAPAVIVGLISSYNEGRLLHGAVSSLAAACDMVGVFEGPVRGADGSAGSVAVVPVPWEHEPERLHLARPRIYKDPAQKRTKALRWALSVQAEWVVWLDADEVLLWGEYLPDWIARAEEETAVGGFPIRIVELDGSVALANGRIVNPRVVRRYLLDANQLELTNGMVVALGNEKVCGAGGIPWGPWPQVLRHGHELVPAAPGSVEAETFLGRHRPPVHGEPHILHRSILRSSARQAQRLHEVEQAWYDEKEPQ